MSIIALPETHEQWLTERKTGIGASDAGTILGVNKWKSNVELWEEKVGLRQPDDISGKPQVQYGHDAEPFLRGLFALDHPELEVAYESPYKIIRNEEHQMIFCTPDGELLERSTGRRGGLEIKTTEIRNPNQWKEWDGRIPDTYFCQVCHQMLATGWEFVWLKAQIKWTNKNGDMRLDTREYKIERQDVLEDIEFLKNAVIKFWGQVQTKTQPALILPGI